VGEKPDWGNAFPLTRLYVVSEGLTEFNFAREILAPHIEPRWPGQITVQPINLQGHTSYGNPKKLIKALLGKPSSEAMVTTMIDLYQLPRDFPGHSLCDGYQDARKRVEEMERFLSEDINDQRFIPYLQLHEFEALILTDVRCLTKYYPKRADGVVRLAESLEKKYTSPEEVNRLRPPSRRIMTVVREYQKAVFGVSAVRDLGIETVRAKCKHFDSWLRKLETLL
jgi:hypothetical protein